MGSCWRPRCTGVQDTTQSQWRLLGKAEKSIRLRRQRVLVSCRQWSSSWMRETQSLDPRSQSPAMRIRCLESLSLSPMSQNLVATNQSLATTIPILTSRMRLQA